MINTTLFRANKTEPMASSLPVFEGSKILSQNKDLLWEEDENGKLNYVKETKSKKSVLTFTLTDVNGSEELAKEAAIQVLKAFDVKTACMHLLCASYAMQLEKPWEEDIVLNYRQIEKHLGLDKRTYMLKEDKIKLIEKLTWQISQVMVNIIWNEKNMKFNILTSRLWEVSTKRKCMKNPDNNETKLIDLTITVRPGKWAEYFLNQQAEKEKKALYQYSFISEDIFKTIFSKWQKNDGACRLILWLLFKTRVGETQLLQVKNLLKIAYGENILEIIRKDRKIRNQIMNTWDNDLLLLQKAGWHITFDSKTYPEEIRPDWTVEKENACYNNRPSGYLEILENSRITISPPIDLKEKLSNIKKLSKTIRKNQVKKL